MGKVLENREPCPIWNRRWSAWCGAGWNFARRAGPGLKLVPSTAGIYVDRLRAGGYLLEMARPVRGVGRPPVLLAIESPARAVRGSRFRARQIFATAVDFAQRPQGEVRRAPQPLRAASGCLEIVAEAIAEVAGARSRNLLGIGLGVPGPVDPARGDRAALRVLEGLARRADRPG